jgi:Tfp pilus assembly protein PilN
MRLDINLASHPYEDARQFWQRWGTGLVALAVLAVLVVGYTGWEVYTAHRDQVAMDQIRKGIAGYDARMAQARATLDRPENRAMRERSAYLNGLFQQKAFSWTKVFEELERVMPPHLHVVSIKPELEDNQLQLKLVVASDSRERALELVRKMEESQRFQQTHIDQESSRMGQRAGEEVQFDISSHYVAEAAMPDEVARAGAK